MQKIKGEICMTEKVDFEKALEINGGGVGEDIKPPKEAEKADDSQFKGFKESDK